MEEQKRTGIPVQEFTFGMVHATVWANRGHNGGLVLKISLRRLETSRDGATAYRTAFYPEDLEDVSRVAIRTGAWVRDAAQLLLPPKTNGADPRYSGAKLEKKTPGAASPANLEDPLWT